MNSFESQQNKIDFFSKYIFFNKELQEDKKKYFFNFFSFFSFLSSFIFFILWCIFISLKETIVVNENIYSKFFYFLNFNLWKSLINNSFINNIFNSKTTGITLYMIVYYLSFVFFIFSVLFNFILWNITLYYGMAKQIQNTAIIMIVPVFGIFFILCFWIKKFVKKYLLKN